ncbi:hypothetical protein PY365_23200 [Roseiarcaceae bacterium H3SJ34-1]|uniref:hypothetical protein n=1 Tax=Terripilifer ovatus TaxID=3032367 RepID=UPI003AB948F8|nr:hypothetical protein [Roseiarcaceae bacterium H3SJ34-1]
MRKIMFACAFAALGTVGFAATEASAKGFGGGHWGGGWGHHGHWGGGHFWGGPRFIGRPVVYFAPRCRWVPGYAGWVRVCR